MSLSMYSASVPVFARALANLRNVLQKAETYATEKQIAPEVLLQGRLSPDMFPLVRQVQIATDIAKSGAARLAAADPMPVADDETTFAQLYARIDRISDYLQTFTPERIDGSETRAVVVPTRANGDLTFDGQTYLLNFVLPNLFFHSSITYAILRESGVPLGKGDFLGAMR